MRLLGKISLLLSILLTPLLFAETKNSDLAGSWYPESESRLSEMLQGYLTKANLETINGRIIGFICPHAGFSYSGPVGAYSYKALKQINGRIRTAIVIGFNHRIYHDGIAVCDFDSYKTPLGEIEIDKGMTNKLIEQNEKIYSLKKAFSDENSTEMQIPFLQAVLNDFKLVIIHIGSQSLENCEIISSALYEVLKDRNDYILIASTDMSHYLNYDEANKIDNFTISLINEFKPYGLYKESGIKGHRLMCGYGAVCATMMAAGKLGADSIEVLKYANSGDETGDKSRVVGYLSAAIVKKVIKSPNQRASLLKGDKVTSSNNNSNTNEVNKMELTKENKKTLIKIVRQTLESYLSNGKIPDFNVTEPILSEVRGAFVTLKKRGELRGCIGNIIGTKPLHMTVRDMAIESATGDPRFPKVTKEELKDIEIEISVLSPLKKVSSEQEIILGKHGVIVKRGFRQGVFLPQVATETGWTKEEFLSYLCTHKAGLNSSCWKEEGTELFVFSACVFSEKDTH